MQLLVIFLAVLTIFVAMVFYYEDSKAELPLGFSQRLMFHTFPYLMNFGFGLTTFLEKLGIISQISVIRVLMDGLSPPLKDKQIFIKDLRFENVEVRIYQPKIPSSGQRRGILYCHGGIGMFGSIRAYDRTCCHLAKRSDSVVVSVGYRLAPEHPYPTQFEDCLTATVHFLRTAQDYGVDPSRIIICGDSSGGTLAAAVTQALVNRRDLPKLRAQILIYPFLQGLNFDLPSYQQNKRYPVLLRELTIGFGLRYLNINLPLMEFLKVTYIPEDLQLKYQKWVSPDCIPHEFKKRGYIPATKTTTFSEELYTILKPVFDTVFSPLLAEDSVIAQLPETFILTCEFDILRDDGLLYKKRLEDHGIKVTWCHLQQGFHGVLFMAPFLGVGPFQSGAKGLENIAEFIRLM